MFGSLLKSQLLFLIVPIVFSLTSYFGVLNPNEAGLLSSVFVAFSSWFLILVSGFLGCRAQRYVFFLVWFLSLALTFSNWWHYQFFQQFFNYQALSMGGDSLSAIKALGAFALWPQLSVLTVVSALFVIIVLRARIYRKPSFVLVLLAAVPMLASGYYIDATINNNKAININPLRPVTLSPIHAFFVRADGDKDDYLNSEYIEQQWQEKNKALSSVSYPVTSHKPVNVLLITLESIRADLIGVYGAPYKATPNLDDFASSSVRFSNYYASANYTSKSETSIWCSIYDNNLKPPYSSMSDGISGLKCLPGILNEKGYESIYFHGNESGFYGRNKYLPKVGFNQAEFFDQARIEAMGKNILGWGLPDVDMYDFMLQHLKAEKAPFFAHVTTLSSHYPFSWNWGVDIKGVSLNEDVNSEFGRYIEAAYYEDYAFGRFLKAFRNSELAENTLLVVTADHGVWSFSEQNHERGLMRDERFFRMPLMIHFPGQRQGVVNEQVASHIDLAPTLEGILGVDSGVKWLGKNAFAKVAEPWAIMMKAGEVRIRTQDTICTMGERVCGGIHQNCASETYGALMLEPHGSLQQCYSLQGDLLRGGRVLPRQVEGSWIDDAFGIIRLHNQRVQQR